MGTGDSCDQNKSYLDIYHDFGTVILSVTLDRYVAHAKEYIFNIYIYIYIYSLNTCMCSSSDKSFISRW